MRRSIRLYVSYLREAKTLCDGARLALSETMTDEYHPHIKRQIELCDAWYDGILDALLKGTTPPRRPENI